MQVVGHTPRENVAEVDGAISTDVFSTNWGKKIGVEKMIVVDTGGSSFEIIDIDFRHEFGKNFDIISNNGK